MEEQKVPEGYVKAMVTEDLSQRVATLEQRALSAERLRPLIERLGLRGISTLSKGELVDVIADAQQRGKSAPANQPMGVTAVARRVSTLASSRSVIGWSTVARDPSLSFGMNCARSLWRNR